MFGAGSAALVFVALGLVDLLYGSEALFLPVGAGLLCALLVLLFPSGTVESIGARGWVIGAGYFIATQLFLTLQLIAYLTGKLSMFYSQGSQLLWTALTLPASLAPFVIGWFPFSSDLQELAMFAVPTVNSALLCLVIGAVRRRRAQRVMAETEPSP